MKIGDLIRNNLTGELSVVTGVGEQKTKSWITLQPVLVSSKLGDGIIYHAEFFEVISEV